MVLVSTHGKPLGADSTLVWAGLLAVLVFGVGLLCALGAFASRRAKVRVGVAVASVPLLALLLVSGIEGQWASALVFLYVAGFCAMCREMETAS